MELIFSNANAYTAFFNQNPKFPLFNDETLMLNQEYKELYNEQLQKNSPYISRKLINLFCDRYGSSALTLSHNFLAYGYKSLILQKSPNGPTIANNSHKLVYYSYATQRYLVSDDCPDILKVKFQEKNYMNDEDFISLAYDCCANNDYFNYDIFISDYDL